MWLNLHFKRLFRGDEGKAFAQIEAHLMTEHAQRARAGAVVACHAVFADVPHQIEVLLHARFRLRTSRAMPNRTMRMDSS